MKTLLFAITMLLNTSVALASDVVILDEISVQNLGLQLSEVEASTFEDTVFALGRVEDIPSHHSILSSRISGRVVEVYVYEGDLVKAGQVLAKIETRQLGDPPPEITLKAPASGVIVKTHIKLGEPVEPSETLMEIVDRSKCWVRVQIPERYASKIRVGTQARMELPAIGKKTFTSSLKRFGVESDPDSMSVEGIFELVNNDMKLIPGMRAEVSLIAKATEKVMSIPLEAVQGDLTRKFVFVEDFRLPYAYQKAPVVLGQQNDKRVQVLKGLFPGDRVVTQGSYALRFSGGSSGMSLKEALDAAHGHEHNEDGSEMTPEQRLAKQKEKQKKYGHDQLTNDSKFVPWLIAYAVVITLLCLVLFQMHLKNRQREVEGA